MGSNHEDYLKEGHRILKPYGNLFICEPKKKMENSLERLKENLKKIGFKIIEVKTASQFVYIDSIKT